MASSKIFRKTLLMGTVVLLATGGLQAAKSARKPNAAGLLGSIPARSVFCVRVNNLDGTLETVNEFLKGVAPESFDADAAVISKLGKMLGDEKLRGINRKQNLAIFAVNVPGKSAGPGPMGNMFIGALLPVRNYDNFVSRNPNCSQPDNEGISTVTFQGKSVSLVSNFRRFAVLCPLNAREKLIRVKKMLAQRKRSLAVALDDDEKKQAATAPVWAYVNVKEASGLIEPVFFGKLEQMKAQLEKMKESGQGPPMMVDPSGIIDFYGGIFKMVMDGTEHLTVMLAPTPQRCNIIVGVKAVPDSDMAAIVGNPVGGDFGTMLGYLDDGAMMNLGTKVDRPSMKAAYVKLIDLVGKMTAGAMPEEDLDKVKTLTAQMIDAIGDSLAISFKTTGQESPMVSIKYVIEVRDEELFKQAIDEQLKMMQEGVFSKLYKGFGMEMDFEIQRQSDTYRGIRIDSAKVAFRMGDENSPATAMIRKIYGDALDYRWAFVRDHCVYAIGADADKVIRELIDTVRAGGPQETGSQMNAALETIPGSRQADAVGTFNYVRMLKMALGIMPMPPGAGAANLDIATTSDIAFAVRTTAKGKTELQIAMPKAHLVEIQSAFKTLGSQIKKQQELQRQK